MMLEHSSRRGARRICGSVKGALRLASELGAGGVSVIGGNPVPWLYLAVVTAVPGATIPCLGWIDDSAPKA